MSTETKKAIQNLYGLPVNPNHLIIVVFFIEVFKSNPNGDPANSGDPRQDPFTGQGEISPGCIKRILRDYYFNICKQPLYVERGADLSATHDKYRMTSNKNVDAKPKKAGKAGKDAAEDKSPVNVEKMLEDLIDIRLHGGTIPRGNRKARGAIQISPAISIDPIDLQETIFTRVAGNLDTSEVKEKTDGSGDLEDGGVLRGTMQSYKTVPFGLYRGVITFNPFDAAENGVTEADLDAFWGGLIEGFNYARSAHRVEVNLSRLYAFSSPATRGAEPGNITRDRVKAVSTVDRPSKVSDYEFSVNTERMPASMTMSSWNGELADDVKAAAK
jgi:Cas7 group CRISPR-associated protein Csh2